MPQDEAHHKALTRRALLRRGAVVGGLLWTAPVIRSVASPAYAASFDLLSCCQCKQGPPLLSNNQGLTCADCQAYCSGQGGVSTYTKGIGCLSKDEVCIPSDTCPKVPCAWKSAGPVRLKPARP